MDGDGFGDSSSTFVGCEAPPGYVVDNTDCNDLEAGANPSMFFELCFNGYDDNCNGLIDDDDPLVAGEDRFYRDVDQDGWGTEDDWTLACAAPAGFVENNGDCDDGDAQVFVGADETCNGLDDDCDGAVDDADDGLVGGILLHEDADGDGFGRANAGPGTVLCVQTVGWVQGSDDCDDFAPDVNIGAVEICDGIDNDCDGLVDGVDPSVIGQQTWYADGDGDGYGDEGDLGSFGCNLGGSAVADNSDCDDGNPAVNPGAVEVCDFGTDNDCDDLIGVLDPSVSDATLWYDDGDQDGYGDAQDVQLSCLQPIGTVANDLDCFDGSSAARPGGLEICDGLDNDCDGLTDDADPDVDGQSTFYLDLDGDLSGNPLVWQQACFQPPGHVLFASDCDDTDATVYLGAVEVCDGEDNDCDGHTDDADLDVVAQPTWYADIDMDGWGDPDNFTALCKAPEGWIAASGDCDDDDGASYPGAPEVCDDVDNDCDFLLDDADGDRIGGSLWFADVDGDGWGAGVGTLACTGLPGEVSNALDCMDSDALVSPEALEVCDLIDNDCDGQADDLDSFVIAPVWYHDGDGDGFGDASLSLTACLEPPSYTADSGDCNDGDPGLYPGQSVLVAPGTTYATVQAAVDAVCDDADVRIAGGTYTGAIDLLGKRVVVRGLDPLNPPVLMGDGVSSVITVSSQEPLGTAVEDVILRQPAGVVTTGAGIQVMLSSSLVVRNVWFDSLITDDSGAGMYVDQSDVTVEGSLFSYGDASVNGGGIDVQNASLTVIGSDFIGNIAQTGGAIHANNSPVVVVDTRIVDSVASIVGGGIRTLGGQTLDLYDVDFVDNLPGSSFNGGSIYATDTEVFADGYTKTGGGSLLFQGTGTARNITLQRGVHVGGLGIEVTGLEYTLYAYNLEIRDPNFKGIYSSAGFHFIEQCTIVGGLGQTIELTGGQGIVRNNIFDNGGVVTMSIGAGFVGTMDHNLFDDAATALTWGGANQSGYAGFIRHDAALDPALWDLHIPVGSLAWNTGTSGIWDTDGGSSDLGAFGGQLGDGEWLHTVDDGLYDGWETEFFGDLTLWGDLDDPDGDGLDNLTELSLGTYPDRADTDGDLVDDGADLFPLDDTRWSGGP
jgi:hypothetical protein